LAGLQILMHSVWYMLWSLSIFVVIWCIFVYSNKKNLATLSYTFIAHPLLRGLCV
jgi:hypothetical protein